MVNPNFKQTITVYRKSVDNEARQTNYIREVINNCSVNYQDRKVMVGNDVVVRRYMIIRLSKLVKVGDYIILGEIDREITSDFKINNLVKEYGAKEISLIKDNRIYAGPHVRAEVEL